VNPSTHASPPVLLVTDTSVLVNFLRIDRMDLIGRASTRFLVTGHVAGEIEYVLYPEQVKRLQVAIAKGSCEICCVDDEAALEFFGRLTETTRLGIGESATIAHALAIGAGLATDDRRAVSEALRMNDRMVIMGTADITVQLIRENLLTVAEANMIKDDWAANHRFKLKFASFAELL